MNPESVNRCRGRHSKETPGPGIHRAELLNLHDPVTGWLAWFALRSAATLALLAIPALLLVR